MPEASSPFLNRPIRSEEQARKDREAQRRRQSDPMFCRQILDGAFERIYSDDGKHLAYRDMDGNLFNLDLKPMAIFGEVE